MNKLLLSGKIVFSVCAVVISGWVIHTAALSWTAEDYCSKNTATTASDYKTDVPVTEQEKKTYGQSVIHDGKITLATRKVFDCEHNYEREHALFIFF